MGTQAMIALGGAAVGAMSKPDDIQAPTPRSYLGEMNSALGAQGSIQARLLGMQNQYAPLWQQQQRRDLVGGMRQLEQTYSSAIPMAGRIGSQLSQAMAPAYAQAGQAAMGAYTSMLGQQAMGIYNMMGQQAQQGLQAGYGLNAQQTQQAQQAARAAMAARGMGTGNQAIAQEVLGSYDISNRRYQQNLSNAQNYLTNTTQAAQSAYNMYGQPLMAQINNVSPAGLMNSSSVMNQNLGSRLFNPESQYNADIMGANQSNAMQTQLGNLQAQGGYNSGMIGLAGKLGGAWLGGLGQGGGGVDMSQVIDWTPGPDIKLQNG